MAHRAPVANLTPGTRTLPPETSHYLCRVLRLRAGDTFVAFDPAAHVEGDATVIAASSDAAQVLVGAMRDAPLIAKRHITLVYALAKGDKVDAVVRDASELGATRIVVARSARSVAKAEGARAREKIERWTRVAEQAARQCGRADPPEVSGIFDWREALEHAARDADVRYCLWERATEPLGEALPAAIERGAALAFAVGPEGGLAESEIDDASALGFSIVSLGRYVLRTETVAAAVLGAVRILSLD